MRFPTESVFVRYRTKVGPDAHGNDNPTYSKPEEVKGVLVAPARGYAMTKDIDGSIRSDGKKVKFNLFFPKTFVKWRDLPGALIDVRGTDYLVIGEPQYWKDTPTKWYIQVDVEVVHG